MKIIPFRRPGRTPRPGRPARMPGENAAGYLWIASTTGHRDTLLGIEVGGCTGSPHCAAGIHLRKVGSTTAMELHISAHEVDQVIEALTESKRRHSLGLCSDDGGVA
jgi:hypothetical protein